MTESEWLTGTDIQAMALVGAGDRTVTAPSSRKWYLFACASCRAVWRLMEDERSREAVEVAERFADGHADIKAMRRAKKRAEVPAFCDKEEDPQERVHAA